MNKHGDFIWYELMTSDIEAAANFYGAVLKWTARETDDAPGGYQVFSRDGAGVGGGMTLPAAAAAGGARPGWVVYIGVDDVDAAVEDILANGGTAHMPARDIPGVGRLAMLSDPQGAMFYVMRGASSETSTAFAPGAFGHVVWNELYTSDLHAALAFYGGRFGWTKGQAMPMGDMGDYQLISHGGQDIGGAMRTPPGRPVAWGVYFSVEDIDDAAEAIRANGGAIMYGPAPVPGGGFSIIAADPQGATVGFVGMRRS